MDEPQENANKEAEALRKQQLVDLRTLIGIPSARRLICRILERTGPLRQTLVIDSERMSCMAAGERNVGLWLLSEIADAYPDAVGGILTDMQKPNRIDNQNP
jgi:hypothetical protein